MNNIKWANTLKSRFLVVSLLPIIALTISIILLAVSLNVLSAARAYVGGESLWSKAQKQGSFKLLKYGLSGSEDSYKSAMDSLQVNLGHKQAREELNKANPNYELVRSGFLKGDIHPSDIDGMIWLYRNFKSISYFKRPIAVWEKGDYLISQILIEAEALHKEVQQSESKAVITSRLVKLDNLDSQLTVAQTQFSFLMGEASRWILNTLIVINIFSFILIMLVTLKLINIINRKTVDEINEIYKVANYSYKGHLDARIKPLKTTELNAVAELFNLLMQKVSDSGKRLEEELLISETRRAQNEAIISNISDGLLVINLNKEIVIANNTAIEMLNVKLKNIIHKSYLDIFNFVSDKTNKTYEVFVDKALEGQTIRLNSDSALLLSNKQKIQISATASPLLDNGTRAITGAIIVFRDVTKERELDKAKSEFVSLASHQLRTPLTAIGWYSEMLLAGQAGKINEEQKTYLDEISGGNKRMIELVNSLLEVSRLETGTFRVSPEPLDIIQLAKDVVKEYELEILKRKQKLVVLYDDKIPTINLDRKLTRVIIQNLLSNATKYTKQSGTIYLSLKAVEDKLTMVVEDNGFGIPKKQQPYVFDKFFRADNVSKLDTEGTGLGLYIIKSIVEQTGGKIWFESSENKGSKFFVTIPISGMKPKKD